MDQLAPRQKLLATTAAAIAARPVRPRWRRAVGEVGTLGVGRLVEHLDLTRAINLTISLGRFVDLTSWQVD